MIQIARTNSRLAHTCIAFALAVGWAYSAPSFSAPTASSSPLQGASIGALSEVSGPQAGGQSLSVGTTGFAPGAVTVRMGGTVTQGTVFGSGANQTVLWTSVAFPAPGLANLRLTQGSIDITKPGAFTIQAPTVIQVVPDSGPWYAGQTLTIQGANFSPSLPATVRFFGEPPLPGSVIDASTVTIAVPPQGIVGAGPLGIIVTQNGVAAAKPGAFVSLPALSISVTGSVFTGGRLLYQVDSAQSGFAVALLSTGVAPVPLPLAGFHSNFGLNLFNSFDLGPGGLLIQPTVQVDFPPLQLQPGTVLYAQSVAVEVGGLGTWYSFTDVVPFTMP